MTPALSAVLASALAAMAVVAMLPPARARRSARLVGDPQPRAHPDWRVRASRLQARVRLGSSARRRAARERLGILQALGALAAELEAGQPPVAAVLSAGGEPTAWPAAAAAAANGGDVADGFAQDAREHPALAPLGACWRVASETGTGFAAAVGRLVAAARAAEDARVQLEAELAGPRATARMLALLPLAGIGFGSLLGSDPLAWLLLTPPGWACLLAGGCLSVLGLVWTGRIAASVERLL